MSEKLTDIERFSRLVKARTEENLSSFKVLMKSENYSVAIGLIRQEIDTFVRVVYLNQVSKQEAERLISELIKGHQWRHQGRNGRITDREMVNIAKEYYFWVEIAYNFGCKLVHLSDIHDYESTDPFTRITVLDKQEITKYLKSYHGYEKDDIDFDTFLKFLPKIINKIHGKVEEYNKDLQRKLAT